MAAISLSPDSAVKYITSAILYSACSTGVWEIMGFMAIMDNEHSCQKDKNVKSVLFSYSQ